MSRAGIWLIDAAATERTIDAVREERGRQDYRWGRQAWRDGTGPSTVPLIGFDDIAWADELARQARAAVEESGASLTWREVLLEEVFEALAEADPGQLRDELIQVAAVALQWVEAIDRRTA